MVSYTFTVKTITFIVLEFSDFTAVLHKLRIPRNSTHKRRESIKHRGKLVPNIRRNRLRISSSCKLKI